MTTQPSVPSFQWITWPKAEALVEGWVNDVLGSLLEAGRFVQALEAGTSTRALDWADYVVVAGGAPAIEAATAVGYEDESVAAPDGWRPMHHPGAQLPRVVIDDRDGGAVRPTVVALKCERVAEVLEAHGLDRPIAGEPMAPLREAVLFRDGQRELRVTERRGHRGYDVAAAAAGAPGAAEVLAVRELWQTRPRHFDDDLAGVHHTLEIAQAMADRVGVDMAAWLAFEVERRYWQRRNRAGQVQKARQDRFGFGWANHDHHTFRSSRRCFRGLIEVLHTLGFRDRERFYAGHEAGWGAQVLEQPGCGLVVFADVDLSPEEAAIDFARQDLPPRQLGTVGLWCGLHGESILQAGMHHLEAQFRFDALRADLAGAGVGMMKPFSDMTHLRQAFTEGERWPVAPARIDRLLAAGLIDPEQADRFRHEGAVGSHLENLQRRFGFKGFNQKNVSDIIARTDPRRVR